MVVHILQGDQIWRILFLGILTWLYATFQGDSSWTPYFRMKKFEKHFFDYLIWKTLAKPFKRAAACIYKSIQCRAIMFWKYAKNRPFLGRKSCPDIWGSRTPYNWPGGLIIDFPQYFYLIEGSWELERFLRGSRTQCVHLPRNEPCIFLKLCVPP